MEIKIALVDSPQQVVINTDKNQEEIVDTLQNFLDSSSDKYVVLEDSKGSKFILLRERIAYVEVGTSQPRAVGFAKS